MKNKLILIACAGALFSTAALAGEKGDEHKTFSDLDTDNSGAISIEEAAGDQQLTQEWLKLDANHDGALEEAEFSRFEEMKKSSDYPSE